METTGQKFEHRSRKRQYRTAEEKRRIVEDTFAPGVSVAIVARQHGVNANQVFHWRKLYSAGMLGSSPEQAGVGRVRLLPVTVEDEAGSADPTTVPAPAGSTGTINIEIPGVALISVEGSADPATLRAVLESLRG